MRIIGVDPGSRITGYGVIEVSGKQSQFLNCGCVRTEGDNLPGRLAQIFTQLSAVITEFQPEVLAIEQVFMHRNADSALKLGQARGAAICAATAAGLSVHEYSARQVKQAIVGRGNAAKNQVQHMVTALLQLSATPSEDAADALAVALCHQHTSATIGRMAEGMRFSRGRFR